MIRTDSRPTRRLNAEDRQLGRMLALGTLLFLLPATVAWLTGWRWCPWARGKDGPHSIVSDARAAAGTYIPYAFMG